MKKIKWKEYAILKQLQLEILWLSFISFPITFVFWIAKNIVNNKKIKLNKGDTMSTSNTWVQIRGVNTKKTKEATPHGSQTSRVGAKNYHELGALWFSFLSFPVVIARITFLFVAISSRWNTQTFCTTLFAEEQTRLLVRSLWTSMITSMTTFCKM